MKIAILYTGGTIGSVGDPLLPLSETAFEKAFHQLISPVIKSKYPDSTLNFIPFHIALDSTNLQPVDWCRMALGILPVYSDHDGFVILHGTDTMAYSASALSFLFTSLKGNGFPNAVLSKPIVVTGAQLPFFSEDSPNVFGLRYNTDALQNVCGAIAAARSGVPEVCLYFNDTLFRGNRTVKTHANEFHAFSSPNYPELGVFNKSFRLENENILHLPTTRQISLDSPAAQNQLSHQLTYLKETISKTTAIPFLAFPAFYSESTGASILSDILEASIDKADVDGIILESYGEGNFPSGHPLTPGKGAVYKTLKTAYDRGIVLVDCTQVLTGVVDATTYAAGSWLSQVGVVGAYDMTATAALTKLIYLLALRNYNGNNWDARAISRLMQTNLTGEIMDVNRLDSRGEWYLGAGASIAALDGSAYLINDFKSGPLLKHTDGSVLWRALEPAAACQLPGRLYMQGNGDLVFYDNSNSPIWSSQTASGSPATSMLILEGESSHLGLRLYIYNYAIGEITARLY